MTDQSGAPQTLDEWMNERRLELDLKWNEVQLRAGGMNRQTLSNIRKSGRGSDLNIRRVERAMRWRPGSIASIEAGGAPTKVEDLSGLSPEEIEMRNRLQEARQKLGPTKARWLLQQEIADLEIDTEGDEPKAAGENDPPNG